MQLVLHTGAHFTEEERLMKCLLRNKEDFARRGVAVPDPGRYRRLIRDTLDAMADGDPSEDARAVLMDAILDRKAADRLILSNANFFGAPRGAVREGTLYPRADDRLARFARLFPADDIELFMALRNPATFLPATFGKSPTHQITDLLGGVPPTDIRWSDFLAKVQTAVPRAKITVWCNEDAPLIWAEIIREMAALQPAQKIVGGFDLLSSIISADGMRRFRSYLKSHPVMSDAQKRRVIAAFLDRFALEEEIEEELDLPGWTDELVERMTELYDADVAHIQQMPGIRVILP
jgi:hypothetical protein